MITTYIPKELENLIIEYAVEVRNILGYLRDGLRLLNQIRVGEAEVALSDAIKADTRGDKTRREILFRLGLEIEDSSIREDVAHLVRRLDLVSEWAKEAARYLTIIPYLEVPVDLREKAERLSSLAVEAADLLLASVKALLEGDEKTANSHATRVEHIEEEADQVNIEARRLLIKHGTDIENPAIVFMFRDFIESLENITDYAEDAADYIRALAIKFKK